MARVVVSARADADVDKKFSEIGQAAGMATVRKYAALFETLFLNLTDYTESGAPRPALGAHVRIGVVRPYW
jgi:plasmid stabilization system protein ParE